MIYIMEDSHQMTVETSPSAEHVGSKRVGLLLPVTGILVCVCHLYSLGG